MGIDTAIRKCLRDILAPNAWKAHPSLHDRLVHIEDLLIRVQSLCYSDREISGQVLFDIVWAPIVKVLQDKYSSGYVILIDDKKNVQSKASKDRTHQERKASKEKAIAKRNEMYQAIAKKESERTGSIVVAKEDLSNIGYDEGMIVTDAGLVWQEGKGDEMKETEPQLFQMGRLMSSDRVAIWKYFCSKLKQQTIPKGKFVILEYSCVGPYIFTPELSGVQSTSLAHDHGESDLSVLYYLWYFRTHPVRIITTDTDTIPIVLSYLLAYANQPEMINPFIEWVYVNQEKVPLARFGPTRVAQYAVDMRAIYNMIQYSRNYMTVRQFLLACILAKTDHYDKSLISDRVSFEVVFESVCILGAEAADVFFSACPYSTRVPQLLKYMKRFRLVCDRVELSKMRSSRVTSFASFVTYDGKLTRASLVKSADAHTPTDLTYIAAKVKTSVFQEALLQFIKNIMYWFISWKTHQDQSKIEDTSLCLPVYSASQKRKLEQMADQEMEEWNSPSRVLFGRETKKLNPQSSQSLSRTK